MLLITGCSPGIVMDSSNKGTALALNVISSCYIVRAWLDKGGPFLHSGPSGSKSAGMQMGYHTQSNLGLGRAALSFTLVMPSLFAAMKEVGSSMAPTTCSSSVTLATSWFYVPSPCAGTRWTFSALSRTGSQSVTW